MEAIQVTRFNFTNQLQALLSDPALVGNLDNLDVNPADPFAKYAPPSGHLSTVNSGAIYDLAYKNRCKKPDCHRLRCQHLTFHQCEWSVRHYPLLDRSAGPRGCSRLLLACLDRQANFVIIIGLCFLEDMVQHLATNGPDPRLVDVIHV
jgi:hypothetical protein